MVKAPGELCMRQAYIELFLKWLTPGVGTRQDYSVPSMTLAGGSPDAIVNWILTWEFLGFRTTALLGLIPTWETMSSLIPGQVTTYQWLGRR